MTTAAASDAPAAHSAVLWRTWFEDGLAAIEREDFLPAIVWLREALRHTSAGGDEDLRNAMTQAHLAWALFKQAQSYCRDVKLSAEALAAVAPGCEPLCPIWAPCPCGDEPLKLPPALAEARARELRDQAWHEAQAAAPRLKFDRQQPPLNLATARATQVAGEAHLARGNLTDAARFLELALTYYQPHLPAQVQPTDAVYSRLFLVRFRLGRFDGALDAAVRLEQRVSARPKQEAWVARLLVCQAETLLRQGEYRRAVSLYPRWRALVARSERGPDFRLDSARGAGIFARSLLMTGDLDEAARALAAAREALECVAISDATVVFDLAVGQTELNLDRGELVDAAHWLDSVAGQPTADAGRLVRFRLAAGRLALARGYYVEARARFAEALAAAETLAEPRLIAVVPALVGLARVDILQGDWKTGCISARCAVDRLEAERDHLRPELAFALYALALGFQHDNGIDESGPLLQKALGLMVMLLGNDHPESIGMHLAMVVYQIGRRHFDEAGDSCRAADALHRKIAPCDGFLAARVWGAEALMQHVRGDLCCAMSLYECALEAWIEAEHCMGKEHPEKSLLMLPLAALLLAQGDEPAALATYVALLPMLDELKCHHPGRMAYEVNRWANLFKKAYRFTEAAWLYVQSAAMYAQAYGPKHPYTLLLLENYARTIDDARMLGRPVVMPSALPEAPHAPRSLPPRGMKSSPQSPPPPMTQNEANGRIEKIMPKIPKTEQKPAEEAKPHRAGPAFPEDFPSNQ